jgi:hypothetical protein
MRRRVTSVKTQPNSIEQSRLEKLTVGLLSADQDIDRLPAT